MGKVIPAITDEWFEREGMAREPQVWEDGSRVDNGPGTFEWWYFDAHFEDGTAVVAAIYSKPYANPAVPCSPQVKLIVTEPSGRVHLRVENLPASSFFASKDACEVRAGNSWIRGDLSRYELHIEAGGHVADLEYVRTVPSWRPGVGKCYFGEGQKDYLGWLVAVPAGKVTGRLGFDGRDQVVQGTGYHDHNFGNIPLSRILDHWYWGRLSIGDYHCIFFQFEAARRYGSEKLPLFMFAKGDRILIEDGSRLEVMTGAFVRHPVSRKRYPRHLHFVWHDGDDRIAIRLSNPDLMEARYLLAEQPLHRRMLARLAFNPWYFRFNANFDLDVVRDGARETMQDRAIFESMMLK